MAEGKEAERKESDMETREPEGKTALEEEKGEGTSKRMKPWEQHAAVISMPRFDYNAPSALLHRSHSAFLITCSIKREKSATKEAISILEKYIGPCENGRSESLENSLENKTSKRQKIFTVETEKDCVEGMKCPSIVEDRNTTVKNGFGLSLVKLTRSGLLLFAFMGQNSPETVDIVSNIFQSLESGSLKSPQWCHRIFPIQATCQFNEKELREVVSKLVLQFLNDKNNKLSRPVKYAVGYNRRGIGEMQRKTEKDASKNYEQCSLLNRSKCFDVVASAVKDAISDSVVDLKSPELSVLVELLPLSGVPNGSLAAAVSVLPQNLVSVKPRLCIKALVSDANVKTGGG